MVAHPTDRPPIPPGALTRRGLLASAAVLAGCGSGDDAEAPRAYEDPGGPSSLADVAILNDAVALERRAVEHYAGKGGPWLRRSREHVAVLERAIRRARGRLNPLGAGSRKEWSSADVEAEKIAFYVDVVAKLADPGLRETVAGLLAGAATSYAEIRLKEGQVPAPEAFLP